MSKPYKFVSEITKAALPMGVTTTAHIKREEVPPILEKLKKLSMKKFADWGEMFFGNCIGEYECWGEETLFYKFRELQADVQQLTMLLVVDNPTTSQQEARRE